MYNMQRFAMLLILQLCVILPTANCQCPQWHHCFMLCVVQAMFANPKNKEVSVEEG